MKIRLLIISQDTKSERERWSGCTNFLLEERSSFKLAVHLGFIDDVVKFGRTIMFADDIKPASINSGHNDIRRMQQDIDNVVKVEQR